MSTKCRITSKAKKIRISADRKHIILLNANSDNYTIFDVDGCLIKGGKKCDKAIRDKNKRDVLVEFKGGHISDGCKQILETLEWWLTNNMGQRPISGALITTYTPAFDTSVQQARIKVKKRAGGSLTLRKPAREYEFADLLG